MGRANKNRFYTSLLTPEGIKNTLIQDIDPIYQGPFNNTYSCFSEDGNKYVMGVSGGMIAVLDFNRCIGEFSNPIVIKNISAPNAAPSSSGLAFSPNSRYIFIQCSTPNL